MAHEYLTRTYTDVRDDFTWEVLRKVEWSLTQQISKSQSLIKKKKKTVANFYYSVCQRHFRYF